MTNSGGAVLHQGRNVRLVPGIRTSSGWQVYEVDGQQCWAVVVVGFMDQDGNPVLVPDTHVLWRQVDGVSEG